MKRYYSKMAVLCADCLVPGSTILKGSKTTVKVDVGSVTVEDYQQGFGTTPDNDFKELTFE